MSCALTQGFVLDCRDSIGGIKEVHIIEFGNIVSFTLTAGVVMTLVKATAKAFFKYQQVKQTSEADEATQASEENGTLHVQQTIKLVINKMQTSVRNEIMLLSKNRLAMVVIDRNGAAWAFGFNNGLLIESGTKSQTGKSMGDRNGYELQFKGFEPELAYSVDPAIVSALQTVGP